MASKNRNGDKPKKNGKSKDFQEDPPRAAAGHNSEQRATALDEALEEFCELQSEEDDLLEKYIAPIREKKNRVKARVKQDYEIPTKAFNARAALRLIEKADDDEVVLAVNEMFKATPVGHNLDLIAIHDRVVKARAEKAAAKNKATATEHEVA